MCKILWNWVTAINQLQESKFFLSKLLNIMTKKKTEVYDRKKFNLNSINPV